MGSVRYQLPLGKELSQYLTKAPFQQIKMVNIEGVYTRTEEKDYDKFLSALGVGFLLRKAATSSTPTMTISKSGEKWSMVTATTLKKVELNFELGKPFDESTPDGGHNHHSHLGRQQDGHNSKAKEPKTENR